MSGDDECGSFSSLEVSSSGEESRSHLCGSAVVIVESDGLVDTLYGLLLVRWCLDGPQLRAMTLQVPSPGSVLVRQGRCCQKLRVTTGRLPSPKSIFGSGTGTRWSWEGTKASPSDSSPPSQPGPKTPSMWMRAEKAVNFVHRGPINDEWRRRNMDHGPPGPPGQHSQ